MALVRLQHCHRLRRSLPEAQMEYEVWILVCELQIVALAHASAVVEFVVPLARQRSIAVGCSDVLSIYERWQWDSSFFHICTTAESLHNTVGNQHRSHSRGKTGDTRRAELHHRTQLQTYSPARLYSHSS